MANKKTKSILKLAACFSLLAPQAFGEPGVSLKRIKFGQVAALEGPAKELGTALNTGIRAAFEEVNRGGGIHGRQVHLISVDDRNEPGRSVVQAHKMINKDRVFGLIGSVGTLTSSVIQPIATEGQVPYIAPMSGAAFLRDSNLENVVNFRAAQELEIEASIRYLMDENNLAKIAILYQDDAFGQTGLSFVKKSMEARKRRPLASVSFPRNTTVVKYPLVQIRKAKPDAVNNMV